MSCKQCGAELADDERFCSSCGAAAGVPARADSDVLLGGTVVGGSSQPATQRITEEQVLQGSTSFRPPASGAPSGPRPPVASEPGAGALEEGAVVAGRFQLIDRLGKGGMGEVFLAFDRETRQQVALKTLLGSASADNPLLGALKKEVAAVRALPPHPNLLRVLDLDFRNQPPFYTMEYAGNGDVAQLWLKRGRKLPPADVRKLLEQILSALAVLHEAGLVHQDIKPQNVLLMPDGTPKLTDFGISNSLREQARSGRGDGSGTLLYMAPEQLRKELCDARVDLYACGIMAVQLLTGAFPFKISTEEEVRTWHEHGTRDFSALPAPFDRVIPRLLAVSPGDRFATATEAREAFSAPPPVAPVPAPVGARPAPPPPQPVQAAPPVRPPPPAPVPAPAPPPAVRRPFPVAPVVVGLGLLVLVGVWMSMRAEDRARELAAQMEAQRQQQEEARRRAEEALETQRRKAAAELAAAEERRRAAEEAAAEQRRAAEAAALEAERMKAALVVPAAAAVPSEAEMRQPIDALYTAWRNLDVNAYAAQWAPGAFKVDLSNGKRFTAEQLRSSRTSFFARLSDVNADYRVQLRNYEDGIATFDVWYTLVVTYRSGKAVTDRAKESYRVKEVEGRWLILENRDYEP